MQTVYILKNSYKSYRALKQLYDSADLSTNIIVVDKFYAKILLLDKRVKSFPFIINTLPTNIGLIPKIANVLPLEMFLQFSKNKKLKQTKEFFKYKSIKENIRDDKSVSRRPKSYLQSRDTNYINKPMHKYINFPPVNRPNIYSKHSYDNHKLHKNNFNYKKNINPVYKNKKPLIKTVKETDGSVNIIMN
tara:strand:- start:13837 stop:14406 length:570 start_codon:yes stop_codon:yes gene_type:complete